MDKQIKEYEKELRTLIDKSNEYFEKQLSYISAGALGLSMIIVEKLVKDLGGAKCKWILFLSWSLLALSLISNLVSHVFTSSKHNKTLKEIVNDEYDYTKAKKRNGEIIVWNIFSIIFLLSGIVFQIIFLTYNI